MQPTKQLAGARFGTKLARVSAAEASEHRGRHRRCTHRSFRQYHQALQRQQSATSAAGAPFSVSREACTLCEMSCTLNASLTRLQEAVTSPLKTGACAAGRPHKPQKHARDQETGDVIARLTGGVQLSS